MKVTVEVDCTPAEAREFMGLPDLRSSSTNAGGNRPLAPTARYRRFSSPLADAKKQEFMSPTARGVD